MKRSQAEQRKNPKRLCKRATLKPTEMGMFISFPEEITQHVFSDYCMPLSSLASLCMTSKTMCDYIRNLAIDSQLVIRPINDWIVTKSCAKIKIRFIEIGMLLRASSSYLNITDKLKVIESFFYELGETEPDYQGTYHRICEDISLKFAYDCIGLLINRFIINWDDKALKRTFELINRLSRLKERMDKVLLLNEPGSKEAHERDVRQFIQEVFLKKAISPDQRSLWLSLLFEMYPTQHARLLYLLYGPLQTSGGKYNGMIDWTILTQCGNYGHIPCPYSYFKELADIMVLIQSSRLFYWNENTMTRFFNELTNTPEPWCLENNAKLMFFLGHNWTVIILQAKLKADRIAEFSHMAYHLAQVSSQNSPEAEGSPESLSWFVKVMFEAIQILPAPSRRSHVISEVFKAWRENIQALSEEFDDPLEDDQEDTREDLRVAVINLASITHLLMEMILINKDSSSCYSSTAYIPRVKHEE
ncbi:hypothetical protein ACHWQZ_G014029 [Mnemiopsis leidyi]